MPESLVCPRGHQWDRPTHADEGSTVVCPTCGDPAISGVKTSPLDTDQWQTIVPPSTAPAPASTPATRANLSDTINHVTGSSQSTLTPQSTLDPTPTTIVAGYEIVSVLGRGAMGVVYKARQLSLNRLVALKMVLGGTHAGPQERARFLAEAEAVAGLQHPNIVQVFEVGSHDGLPFFSMEIAEGGTLDGKAREKPMSAEEAAAVVEKLARAMHYAHQRGVVHRDLKPANVLMTTGGEPKITDFGLAKRMESDPNATEARYATQSGATVGTPSFMAPEQALGQGKLVGPLADVYSLGALLYDLLTGRPPFVAATVVDTLVQVAHAEPTSPSVLRPQLPWDLVTICLKCLRKEPDKRYGTAGELADDLRRFLNGEPIHAVPVTRSERFIKWVKRRPTAAALVAVSIAAAATVIGININYQIELGRALNVARSAQQAAETEQKVALDERRKAEESRQMALAQLVRLSVQSGMDLVDHDNPSLALPLLAEALRLSASMDPEFNLPKQMAIADTLTQRMRLEVVREICPTLLRMWFHDGEVLDCRFSPDGKRVVTAGTDGLACVWDVASWERVGPPLRHEKAVLSAVFSPDGNRVLTASADGVARVWETATGREVCRSPAASHGKLSAAFHPDGRRFGTAGEDGITRVCDAETGRELFPAMQQAKPARLVMFSPNGKFLLTVAGDAAKLWNPETGVLAFEFRHEGKQVLTAAIDRDGKRLATGGEDNARIWDLTTGRPIGSPLFHRRQQDHAVLSVCFSPDGSQVATGSEDGTALIWPATGGEPLSNTMRHQQAIRSLEFSPDGRRIITGSDDDTAVVWNVPDGHPYSYAMVTNGDVQTVCFSPDGQTVLTGSQSGAARLWKPVPGFRSPRPVMRRLTPSADAVSPDGKWSVVSEDGIEFRIRDNGTGAFVGPTIRPGGVVLDVEFSPSGDRILTASNTGKVQLWDRVTGRRTPDLAMQHGGPALCGVFSLDGELVATGGADNTCRVWNADTGEPLTPFMKHNASVIKIVFSPNRCAILTLSMDGIARVWCSRSGERLSPPMDPDDWPKDVFASPTDPTLWVIPFDLRSAADLEVEAQWLSGHRIDRETGGLVPISLEGLRNLTLRIRKDYPNLTALPSP